MIKAFKKIQQSLKMYFRCWAEFQRVPKGVLLYIRVLQNPQNFFIKVQSLVSNIYTACSKSYTENFEEIKDSSHTVLST